MMRKLIFLSIYLGFSLTLILPITRAEAEWATFVQNESRLCAMVTMDFDPCGKWCESGPNWTRMGCPENFTMVDASPPGVVCKIVNCGLPNESEPERSWTETLKHKILNLVIYLIDRVDLALSYFVKTA